MNLRVLAGVAGTLAVGAMLVFALPVAVAQDQPPVPSPMKENGTIVNHCGKPRCQPACPPSVVYKGCPAPCNVEKVVTVSKPCGCTVDVAIKVPQNECERVRVQSDGDARYHYGRHGVHLDWRKGGNELVVRYHG